MPWTRRTGWTLCAALLAAWPVAGADSARAEPVHGARARSRAKPGASSADHALKQLRRSLRSAPSERAALVRWAALAIPITPLRAEPASEAERARAVAFLNIVADTTAPELAPYVAVAHALAGDFAAAIATFSATSAPPDDAELAALLSSASLADASGRDDIAEQILRAGLARAPTAPPLLAALGLALLAQGRAEEAVPYLATRSDLERRAARARNGGPGRTFSSLADLAYAMMASGEPLAASALLEAGCSVEDQSACAALRIRAALESEQVKEALSLADEAVTHGEDNNTGVLYLQAEAATRLGDFPRARAAYERILRVSPGELRARQGLESLDATTNTPPR